MTKKDYIAFANMFSVLAKRSLQYGWTAEEYRQAVERETANIFALGNIKFNRERFEDACKSTL